MSLEMVSTYGKFVATQTIWDDIWKHFLGFVRQIFIKALKGP